VPVALSAPWSDLPQHEDRHQGPVTFEVPRLGAAAQVYNARFTGGATCNRAGSG
jgi:hypothetical protein